MSRYTKVLFVLLSGLVSCVSGEQKQQVQLLEGNRYIVYLKVREVWRFGQGKEKEAVKSYLVESRLVPIACSNNEIRVLGVSFTEGGWAVSQFECVSSMSGKGDQK